MRIRASVVAGLVLVCVLAALAAWFWVSFDRVPVIVEGGPERAARANPFLAAERLLNEIGYPASAHARLSELPPPDTALFMPGSRRKLSSHMVRQLTDWVSGGGHLLVSAQGSGDGARADPLVEGFGVRVEHDTDAQQEADAEPGEALGSLAVEFSGTMRLRASGPDADVLASDAHGARVISVPAGRGRLTVASDYDFASNESIGRHDHAVFLVRLIELHGVRAAWLVLRGDEVPGLWERLRADAWQAMSSIGVLLVLWIWSQGLRFGPLLSQPGPVRRRLLEHIEASGRFMWRRGKADALLQTVRESLLRSIEFRHPGWSGSARLYRRLEEMSGLPMATVKAALETHQVKHEQRFVQIIRTLETLRKKL